jgi:hypothetical protein
MNSAESLKVMAYLKAMFPRQELGADTIAGYGDAFRAVPFLDAMVAARKHVATSTFFPSVAELLKLVAAARVDAPPVEVAWAEVIGAIRAYGRYREPVWSHPLVAAAVGSMGWLTFCNSENITIEHAQFTRVYNAYAQRETDQLQMSALVGGGGASRLPAGPTTAGDAVAALIGRTTLRLAAGEEKKES